MNNIGINNINSLNIKSSSEDFQFISQKRKHPDQASNLINNTDKKKKI